MEAGKIYDVGKPESEGRRGHQRCVGRGWKKSVDSADVSGDNVDRMDVRGRWRWSGRIMELEAGGGVFVGEVGLRCSGGLC